MPLFSLTDQDLTTREEQHASLSNAYDCAANPGFHRNRRAHLRCAVRAPCFDRRPGTAQSDRLFAVLRCCSNGHLIYTNTDGDLAVGNCDARRIPGPRMEVNRCVPEPLTPIDHRAVIVRM